MPDSKPHQSPQGAHVRLAEADTADLFRIVRNPREPGWAREVALKRIEEQLEAANRALSWYEEHRDSEGNYDGLMFGPLDAISNPASGPGGRCVIHGNHSGTQCPTCGRLSTPASFQKKKPQV